MNVRAAVAIDPDLPLELVFKQAGGVEVRQPYDDADLDKVIWASDSDPNFMDKFNKELFDVSADCEPIMDYLVAARVLTDNEADELEIFEEGADGPDDDDESDDDDEG